MMKLQGLIDTARCSSGGRRPTFGFDILTFVEVVFFFSSSLVGVVLFPSPAHLWNWIEEHIWRGRYASKGIFFSPASSIIPFLPSFLLLLPFIFLLPFPFLFLFPFLVVFSLTGVGRS